MPVSPADGARYGRQVAEIISQAEITLLRMISDGLRTGTQDSRWAEMKLAELQLLRRRMVVVASKLDRDLAIEIHQAVLNAYNAGSAAAVKEMDRLRIEPKPVVDPIGEAERIAQRAVINAHAAVAKTPDVLVDAYLKAIAAGDPEAVGAMPSMLGRVSNLRGVVDQAFPDVLNGSLTRIQGAQQALDDALSRGITGFTDAAGRNWSLDSYIEMSVRTGTMNAAVGGHVASLQSSGLDLVIVSSSPASCPLCDEWEGKILSLSGDVDGGIMPDVTGGDASQVDIAGSLDDATDAGLFHPNCTHTVDAYLPGATEADDAAGDAPTEQDLEDARNSPGDQEYQDVQTQRSMERDVRAAKRAEALSWDDADRAKQGAKVDALQQQLHDFVEAKGLRRLPSREQIGRAH